MKTNLLKTAIVAVLICISTNMKAFTAVVSGAWSNAATWGGVGPGSTVSNQDIVIPSGITVDLDVDATFSGLLNSFTVDGTLNSASNMSVAMTSGTFAGAGTVNIHRLSFNGLLTTSSFTGSLMLNSLQNQGATLALAALINVSDTLDLDGGATVLNSGANLSMGVNSNVRVNNGTLTTGGGLFTTTSAYDVWYWGTSKTTGLEVNSTTLHSLHIHLDDNTQVLTQGMNNLVVNGNINLIAGQYTIGSNHLTLKGDVLIGSGAMFTSTATSDLTIEGSGSTSDALMFSTGSSMNNLEIDRSSNGNVMLGSALSIAGTVFLTNGDLSLESGSTLTMNTGSTIQVADGDFNPNGGTFIGTASYDVEYIGGTHTSDVELTGSGLNNVTLGMGAASDSLILADDITINGNLDMNSGMFVLDGNDLILDGTFNQVSNAYFVGDSTSSMTLNLTTSVTDTIYFGGGNQRLQSLILNIPASSTILLASDLAIYDQLTMTSGKIELTNSNLHLRPSASVNGYTDTKYIVTSGTGQVEMQVNSNANYVTFPIGTSSNYSPAYIQQTSTGGSGMFKVRAMNGVYAQGTTGYNTATTESVVNKTWVIDAAAAVNVNMNLKLGWKMADENNGFNRNQAHIAHYMSNAWDTYTTGAAVTGSNSTYEITRTGITSLSPFAVVDTAAALSVEENVLAASINVYPNPSSDYVTVETNATHGTYMYELYDASGKSVISFSNSESVNKFDLTQLGTGFYFIRITNTDTHTSVTKRIVKS